MIHGDVLGERSRLSPNKEALICVPSGMRLTYAELNDRAIRCARFFAQQCGLEKGDRVGILAKNRVEFLDAFFAAGKSGVILVPLNTRLTPAELGVILKDSGAKALLYDGESAAKVRNLKQENSLAHWIALDDPVDASDLSYANGLTQVSLSSAGWTAQRCLPEDIYCLLYTSGTTGKPKGVKIPHRMVSWNGYNTATCWQLREEDVSPVFTPLYHAGGLAAFLVPIFVAGGTIVLHREFDAAEVWRTIERQRCTVMLGVPTIYKMLAEAPEFEHADLSHVRWFISGGAPLSVELIEIFRKRGVVLRQGYGLTEVGVNCFSMSSEESIRKAGSIGKPMMFTEARIADADGREVSCGEGGELWLRGPHVCSGYWNNPEATDAALDAKGWFHTGDIARRDAEGFFYIVGRSKDMFISGGVNVYPAEIEAELLKHPGVCDAAVIGVSHPKWGEVGVAFLVAKGVDPPASEELTDFLAAQLAKYKIPQQFIFVQHLPRTAYGKVVKGQLQKLFQDALVGVRQQ
ncbi:MAG: long-chain fatty acid--CoA ligase [Terriglobales bacterium]